MTKPSTSSIKPTHADSKDGCYSDSTPVTCYAAELRSLGQVRGQLIGDAEAAKAALRQKDAELQQLQGRLNAAAQSDPAYQFLNGTWCDEQVQSAGIHKP